MKTKILFFALILLSFLSCTKEEDVTTFQIMNNKTKPSILNALLLDGSLQSIVVYGFNSNSDLVSEMFIEDLSVDEKTKFIEVPKGVVRLQVSFVVTTMGETSTSDRVYTRVYVIENPPLNFFNNTIIHIFDNTEIKRNCN